MDAPTLFDVAEKTALTTIITQALQEMVQRLKGRVTGKDKKEIHQTTEKIVQATVDDVYRFDPKFREITDTMSKRKPGVRYMRRFNAISATSGGKERIDEISKKAKCAAQSKPRLKPCTDGKHTRCTRLNCGCQCHQRNTARVQRQSRVVAER